jgi:hypothetical protein
MTQAGSDLLQPATPVGGHVAGTHHLDPGRTLRSTDEIRRCPLRLPPQRPLEPKRRDPSATTQTERGANTVTNAAPHRQTVQPMRATVMGQRQRSTVLLFLLRDLSVSGFAVRVLP